MLKLIYHPFTLGVLTIISLLFSLSLYKSTQKTKQSTQNLRSIEQEVLEVEQEVWELEKALEDAGKPLAEEKIIRNELLMQKKGEYVVQIPDEVIKTKKSSPEAETTTPWEEWRGLLF